MSTYYKFICPECKKAGGFLTRQAWGTGNFDIIETFKFLGLHKDHKPYLVSENTADYENIPKQNRREFVEESRGIMPHSNDWELVNENDWEKVEGMWEKDFIEWEQKFDDSLLDKEEIR